MRTPKDIFIQDTLRVNSKISLDTIIGKHENADTINRRDTDTKKEKLTLKINSLNKHSNDYPSNINTETINIQPDFIKINPTIKTLLLNYKETSWYCSLEGNSCDVPNYQKNNHEKTTFFITEKNTNTSFFKKDLTAEAKIKSNQDWILLPLLLGVFVLVSVMTIYRKYLGQLFERFFYHLASTSHHKERNPNFQKVTIILDFIFIISFSLLLDQVVRRFNLFSYPYLLDSLFFLVFCSFLILFRALRWVIYKMSSLFSDQKQFFGELYNNSNLYTRALGVFLLPLVFLIAYSNGLIATILIYLAAITIFSVLIIRTLMVFRVFISGGFSIFYFILYLCALEIAPLLIIWKEVSSR